MDAVRISEENAHNQLTDQFLFDYSDLLDLNEPNGDFDCVVTNIQAIPDCQCEKYRKSNKSKV